MPYHTATGEGVSIFSHGYFQSAFGPYALEEFRPETVDKAGIKKPWQALQDADIQTS